MSAQEQEDEEPINASSIAARHGCSVEFVILHWRAETCYDDRSHGQGCMLADPKLAAGAEAPAEIAKISGCPEKYVRFHLSDPTCYDRHPHVAGCMLAVPGAFKQWLRTPRPKP